jgi:hypothetical protein
LTKNIERLYTVYTEDNGKDIKKYLKTAITNHRDNEDFEKDNFLNLTWKL